MRRFAIGVLALTLLAVTGCEDDSNSVAKKESKYQGQVQRKLNAQIGPPKVEDSLELRNLKRRYELLDDKNKVGYVYTISHGLIFAEYQVKGKVSSLNSQFTNPDKESGPRESRIVISQAEPDGSYGKNPEGVFFFTTDGVYVEWAGDYLYSDQKLDVQQPTTNIIAKPIG